MDRAVAIARFILRYALLLALMTPLIILRESWSPTNFGKVIFFRVVIEIAFACWLFIYLKKHDFRSYFSFVFMGLIMFSASFLVSTLLGSNIAMSFWGGYERMGGFFNFIHYILLFWMLVSVFNSQEDWDLLIHFAVFIGIASAIYGWFQLGGGWKFVVGSINGGRNRIFGTVGNPAMFAGYELFIFYWLLFLGFTKEKFRYLYFIFMIFVGVSIFLTYVRGAVFALLVSLLCLIILWIWDKEKLFKIKALALLSLAFLVSLLLDWRLKLNFFHRLSLTTNSDNWLQRIRVWPEGIRGFLDRPIFGWGPDNFTLIHEHFFDPRVYLGAAGSVFDRAHNLFIEVLATQGLLGLITLLLLILAVVVSLIKYPKVVERRILGASFIAYLIQAMFFFDTVSVYIMLIFALAYLSFISPGIKSKIKFPEIAKSFLSITIIVLIPLSVYFLNIQPYLANVTAAHAAVVLSQGDVKTGMELFKKSITYYNPVPYRTEIVFNVAPVFNSVFEDKLKSISHEDLKNYLSFLINEYGSIIKNNPKLSEGYTGLNSEYIFYAHYIDPSVLAKSEELLKKDLAINPTMVSVWLELGNLQSIRNEPEASVKSFKKAYQLNNKCAECRFYLGRAEFLNGNKQDGLLDIQGALSSGYVYEDQIISLGQFLLKNRDSSSLIKILTSLSDSDPNYLVYLAIAYKDSGDILNSKITSQKMLDYKSVDHPIAEKNYETLADLYLYFHDIKNRTKAFEKAGVLMP